MEKLFRQSAVIALSMAVVLSYLSVTTSAANACSWYCRREKDHRRPSCPTEFRFVEEENCVWIDPTVSDGDEEKVVYLTFDAGYENGNVAKILDVLREKDVRGTFFILLNLIDREPELVRRMHEEGHLIGNHTAHHKDMSKITDKAKFASEINQLADAYRNLTGAQIGYYYRPPEGRFTRENLRMVSDLGYTTVLWSFAYADWDNSAQASPEEARAKILDNVHNGAILLLHPTSETNAKILGGVIDTLREEGYRFETVDKIGLPGEN